MSTSFLSSCLSYNVSRLGKERPSSGKWAIFAGNPPLVISSENIEILGTTVGHFLNELFRSPEVNRSGVYLTAITTVKRSFTRWPNPIKVMFQSNAGTQARDVAHRDQLSNSAT
jgi:hypothetical protein